MSRKPAQMIVLSLIIALAMFFGAWAPALAQEDQPAQQAQPGGTTIAMGNQGVFVPVANAEESFEITRVSKNAAGFAPGDFVRDLVRVETTGDLGNNPFALTYVFFELDKGNLRAYRNGDLGILFRGADEDTWSVCNSFLVSAAEEDESGRIACIAPRYDTIFGVAHDEDGLFTRPAQQQTQQEGTAQGEVLPATGQEQGQQAQQDQPAQQADGAQQAGTTIPMGNQGIFVPVANAEESFEITRVSKNAAGFAQADFLRDLIRVETTGDLGNNPFALTYVFFELNAGEMRGFRNGEVGILYRSVDENTWNVCNSFLVSAADEDESGRIACIAPRYNTIFGVARADDAGTFAQPVQQQQTQDTQQDQ